MTEHASLARIHDITVVPLQKFIRELLPSRQLHSTSDVHCHLFWSDVPVKATPQDEYVPTARTPEAVSTYSTMWKYVMTSWRSNVHVNIAWFCCFGDDSYQRDARHSHHREDRKDAENAHCVCTILFYLNSNSNKIYHSICQQID